VNSSFFSSSLTLSSVRMLKLFNVGVDVNVEVYMICTLLSFVSIIHLLFSSFLFLLYLFVHSSFLGCGIVLGIGRS